MMHRRRAFGRIAGLALAALAFTACGANSDSSQGDGAGEGAMNGSLLEGETIDIAVFEGWDEGIAASFLMGNVFEGEGATVNYRFGAVAPVFSGIAEGEFDVAFDLWLPNTHADYWDEHGDDLENLGAWYDEARLAVAVNEGAPVSSLEELAGNADAFGDRILGIEPGSGLNRIIREDVIPGYGLDDMELIESSTSDVVSELRAAMEDRDDIVVAMWQPHWAYAAYPIRNLEDPQNLLGDPEQIHSFGHAGFAEDHPAAAELISNFTLTEDQLSNIEEIMVVKNEASSIDEYAASIQEWLDDNPDWVEQLKAGKL